MSNLELFGFILYLSMGLITFLTGMGTLAWAVRKTKENPTISVLTCLKGSQRPNEITIGLEADAQDNLLSTTVTANKLVARNRTNPRILVFSSVILNTDEESIEQTLALLRAASALDMKMDWVNDSVPDRWVDELVSTLTRHSLRCDDLLSDINSNTLYRYDIIFHPKAGMKASYETLSKVMTLLSNDSTTTGVDDE